MHVWGLILLFYSAPYNARDWHGPWEAHKFHAFKEIFPTEQECLSIATEFAKNMNKGMKAPIRFKCVSFEQSLSNSHP